MTPITLACVYAAKLLFLALSKFPVHGGVVVLLRRSTLWLAIVLLFPCTATMQAQQGTAPAVGVESYPDSTDGLKRLLDHARQITQAGKVEELRALARDLTIPDHPRWFASTFGGGLEDVLSAAYTESTREMDSVLPQLLSSLPMEKSGK